MGVLERERGEEGGKGGEIGGEKRGEGGFQSDEFSLRRGGPPRHKTKKEGKRG